MEQDSGQSLSVPKPAFFAAKDCFCLSMLAAARSACLPPLMDRQYTAFHLVRQKLPLKDEID